MDELVVDADETKLVLDAEAVEELSAIELPVLELSARTEARIDSPNRANSLDSIILNVKSSIN